MLCNQSAGSLKMRREGLVPDSRGSDGVQERWTLINALPPVNGCSDDDVDSGCIVFGSWRGPSS